MESQIYENISLENSGLEVGLLNSNKSNRDLASGIINSNSYRSESGKDLDSSVIESLNDFGRSNTRNNNLSFVENIPLSADCSNGTTGVSSMILSELLKYDLKDYLNERLIPKYSFFRRVPVDDIMKWQSKEISGPLTKVPKELEGVAIQLFRNLLSYMNDRKSSKRPIEHARKFIKLTLTASEEMRDEGYVQVLKQIKDHKDSEKANRGWNFLAILASCICPSEKLFYSILNYLLFEIKNNSDSNLINHANYIFLRLYKTHEIKRKNVPSFNEITYIEQMKPLVLPVYFFSESSSNIEVESYTTVREMKTNLMKKLQFNVSRIPYYCLYESCNKKDRVEERFLEENERVADIISLWDKDIEEYSKNKEQIEFKFYLKIFLHYPYQETDIDTVTAVFTQSVYDVVNGKYNLTEQDIITLASLQLLVEFGTSQDLAYQNLQKKLERFLPIGQINLNPGVYWIQKIMELYSGLKASSKLEAKLTYIEQLKSFPTWEAHQFLAKYNAKNLENPEDFPEDIIIGIKPDRISVLDLERNELKSYPYHIIVNWGISTNFFVIIVSESEGEVVKHYFETNQTKIVQALLESYTNLIAGKSILEIQNITGGYVKRFESLSTGRSRQGTNYSKNSN